MAIRFKDLIPGQDYVGEYEGKAYTFRIDERTNEAHLAFDSEGESIYYGCLTNFRTGSLMDSAAGAGVPQPAEDEAAHTPKPAMEEPTEIGSVVTATTDEGPVVLTRTLPTKVRNAWTDGFARFKWGELIDPRPATPEERRTGIAEQPVMIARPTWEQVMTTFPFEFPDGEEFADALAEAGYCAPREGGGGRHLRG